MNVAENVAHRSGERCHGRKGHFTHGYVVGMCEERMASAGGNEHWYQAERLTDVKLCRGSEQP